MALVAMTLPGCALTPSGPPAVPPAWLAPLPSPTATATPANDGNACLANEDFAVSEALARDPRSHRLSDDAAGLLGEAEVSRAGSPSLRLTNLRTDRLASGPARAELALRVPIARPGTLNAERDLVTFEAADLEAEAALARRALATDVRVLWAKVLAARDRAALRALEAERLAAIATSTATSPENTTLEREAARLELVAAELALATARADTARFASALLAVTGRTPCEAAPAPDPAAALALAAPPTGDTFASHPALLKLAAERRHAETARALAARETWPWLDWVQLGYEVDGGFAPDTWTLGVAIDLPIGRWSGGAGRAQDLRLRAIDAEGRRVATSLQAEAEAARRELEARLQALSAAETAANALTDERLDALSRLAPGQVLIRDLRALERDRARLFERLIDARLAALEARARLLAVRDERR